MMGSHRRVLVGVIAGVLAITGVVATPSGAVAEGQTINWQPCPDAEGVECATLEVPLDWANPDGEKIGVGLARRKATDQANRIGSILMDPGGPGGSGVDVVKNVDVFTEQVTARFDVVGFDPRGINASTQVRCDDELSSQAADARRPANQAEFDQLVNLNKQLHDSCRQHSGDLVDHVDTRHVARDMDAIRAALGERKLNYVGYSYGTIMGQQYAEMFPKRIRAMVLDGNMDHSIRTAWEFMSTETEPVERNFLEFADWCDETASCALHGLGTRQVYGELRDRAKAGTLTDPETGEKVDFYRLSQFAFGVNRPQMWADLATLFKALHTGSGTGGADLTALAEPVNNVYPSVWCSDWRFPIRNFAEYDRLRTLLALKNPNIQWTPYVDHAMTCAGDPVENTNPQQRLDIDGAPPLVMIGNIHDPATVYRWTRTAARQSGARLLTYEGWGHTIYGDNRPRPSECVNDAIDAYLIDLTVPKRGLSCPAMEQPGDEETARDLNPRDIGPYAIR